MKAYDIATGHVFAEFVVMHRSRRYTVQLIHETDGRITVRVPALPEVVTWGETEAEALAHAEEAVLLALEVRMAEGDELPGDVTITSRILTVAA